MPIQQQVYMFDPRTGVVRVVADTFVLLNGIALGVGGKTGFATDTGIFSTAIFENSTATIYQYDIDPVTFQWSNRRTFCYIDAGIPDGIQVDTNGNVYAATLDGVQVFRKDGTLIGKIFIGGPDIANMAFAGDSNLLFILAGNVIYAASIHAKSNLVVS